MREEFVRAGFFALSLFAILFVGFGGVAVAANGGIFGDLMNKILVKNWDDPTNDGTVKNSERLSGKLPTEFVQLSSNPTQRSCGKNTQNKQTCIIGFENDGSVKCSP
jgi:hypothetical protein